MAVTFRAPSSTKCASHARGSLLTLAKKIFRNEFLNHKNMYCNHCGSEISDQAVICVKCGILTAHHDVKKEKSGYSIASLVFGIISFLGGFYFVLPPIMAVIFGHIAISQIRNNPLLGGKAMARIGLILGYTVILIYILLLLAMIIPAMQKNTR